MIKRIIILFAFTFFFNYGIASALDWKKLHEEADVTNFPQAQTMVRDNPGSADKLYLLALVCLNLHKDREAGEYFNKIIALDPKAYQAQWGIAEVLRREHKIEKSEQLLNEVIKQDSGFSPAYITLGYIKYTQLDFNRAVKLASFVIDQGRDNVDISNYTRAYLLYAGSKGMLANLGGPLAKIISGTAVLPNLKRAEKMQPESAAVLFGLGSFYFLAPKIAGGNIQKAQNYLERALRADPMFADAYVRLSQVYKIQGDKLRSAEYLAKAAKIDPGNQLLKDAASGECKFICVTLER